MRRILNGRAALAGLVCVMILFGKNDALYAASSSGSGQVEISLLQYDVAEDGSWELAAEPASNVLPGEAIRKVERIWNESEDCYVRLRQEFSLKGAADVNFSGDGWIIAPDGYWYYTEILYSESHVDLAMDITIAEDLDAAYMGSTIWQTVEAEAIQAEGFTPDFDADEPWEGKEADGSAGGSTNPTSGTESTSPTNWTGRARPGKGGQQTEVSEALQIRQLGVVKTGDDTNLAAYLLLGGVSFMGLMVLILYKIKKAREEKQDGGSEESGTDPD